ncbi:T9SS type A sorting domain-containing protein [Flavobacterium sp. Fl-77]|uniref:T9SS type A sorting domain-containing protein n=1 Tax=Flavobacterium flavipigmentatum TaxID=2893884 RepID=A0AAJ2SE86_9FLAO|nr:MULTISPECIES: T9SS type A sorting domain-containing protein [unclassified Flavobacterium]MDX6181606.1 T9SS type A sorting domain-containing protein [Flavobacterium sp. Fl-33]MDX6185360.1 T9SS type A sorting domain-containing protein [Flavobacterium sp. Fl-77]UFH37464.1 T9SS type A sorting domain-containing protein [Flavobacterium sp. F-70]
MKKYYLLLLFFTSLLGYSQVGALQGDGSRAVTITEPSAILISGTAVDAKGFNETNGQITGYGISGGTPFGGNTYTQNWTRNGLPFTMTNFNTLSAGSYVINVSDSKGCPASKTFIVNQPALLEVTISNPDKITCNGKNTGTLTANPVEGYPIGPSNMVRTYFYEWYETDDLAGTNPVSINQYSKNAINLKAGFYKVIVKDQANNVASVVKELEQNKLITVTPTLTHVKCFGEETGAIILNIINGTGAYTVTWNDGPTTKDRTNLSAGIYTYTITDANVAGCSVTGNVTITEPSSPLVIDPITQTQPSTPLSSDGTIKVTASGGTLNYTYNWTKDGDPFTPNTDPITGQTTGLSNGKYKVVVVDGNNCTEPSAEIVLDALGIVLLDKVNVYCKGDTSGSITIKGVGGFGNYDYQWYKMNGAIANILNGETNPSLTNREFGTYRIIVKDGVNPDAYEDYELTEPAQPLTATFTATNVNCAGGNDGTAFITAVGGTPDNGVYNYQWYKNGIILPAVTTASSSTLSAGVYKIIIKDKLLCSTEVSFTLTAPQPIIIPDATITKVAIFGQSTGAIALNPVTGGNSGYSYKWTYNLDPLFLKTTKDISSLKAGIYTVEVHDAKAGVPDNTGCIATRSFTVTQNPELLVTLNETKSIQCNGDFNGEIKANVIGGVLGYTYQWSNSKGDIIGGDSNTISNLGAEQYKVIVTDSQGAQTTSAVLDLIQPEKLTVSLTNKTNVLCFGNDTGIINIDVIGGTKPYTFEWKKDNDAAVYATTEDLATLKSGVYSIYISDDNDCITKLENITITQPSAPLIITDIEVKNLSGFETTNGKIEVSISGGTPAYTYAWRVKGSPTVIGNAKLLDQLKIGTYELTVTDSNNCTIVKEYSLIQPDKLLITGITQTDYIKCFNNKQGVLQATITGGAPIGTLDADKSYIYKWYNQLTPSVVASTTNPSEALLAGTYLLEVSDGFGNSFTSTPVTIAQPALLKINYTQQNVSCKNGQDGAINITITGGTAPYSIVWSTGQNTNQNAITGLRAATYTVTVTDDNLCTTSEEVTITEPDLLYLSQIVKTPPSALGVDDASIAVTVQGGTPNYNFQWYDKDMNLIYTDNNKASNTSIYNIYVGQYFISVTDAKGCVITKRDLDQVDPLFIEVNQINIVKCHGDATASIKANTTGGLPTYYYKWYEISNPAVIVGQAETLTNAKAGTYYVVATDSFGKSIQSQNITITEPAALTNSLSAEYVRCGDGNDWTITSAIAGGTLPYTYLWNTGAKTANLANTLPGNYSLLVTDNNGCTITKTITITAPTHLSATQITKIPTCFGGSDASIVVTPVAGIAPYSYLWNTGETSNILSNAKAGTYTLELKDNKGCIINETYIIENPPKEVIDLGEDVTLCFDQTLTINATISDDQAKYLWTSDKGFTSNKAMITVSEAANYTVVVTNRLGCEATDTIKIGSQSTAISAEFAMSSQAFLNEKIIIVDISNPIPDSLEWVLPAGANIISKNKDYAELSFNTLGEHDITLITKKGNCVATQTKTIMVTEGEYQNPDDTDAQKKFDLKIYPNPSSGKFTVDVTLDKIMPGHIKVYNLSNNQVIASKYEEGKDNYSFNFELNGLASGIYFVLFESQQGTKLRKIIIQ